MGRANAEDDGRAALEFAVLELEAAQSVFEALGFRLEGVFPADDPRELELWGWGLRVVLVRAELAGRAVLRLPSAARPQGDVPKLEGLALRFDPDVPLPATPPRFELTRLAPDAWITGRAGMRYRDLLPSRRGGRFIVSHIAIPGEGPVPDYVHFHRVRAQSIHCLRGWVELVYEDQGPPFVLQAGDAVIQPPEIRHRVLRSGGDLEVLEFGHPAEHPTRRDHEMQLPNSRVDADRRWSGQRFVRHVMAEATAIAEVGGFEVEDLGLSAATQGLFAQRIFRAPTAGARHELAPAEDFAFAFVAGGRMQLEGGPEGVVELEAGEAFAWDAEPGRRLLALEPGAWWIEIRLPG